MSSTDSCSRLFCSESRRRRGDPLAGVFSLENWHIYSLTPIRKSITNNQSECHLVVTHAFRYDYGRNTQVNLDEDAFALVKSRQRTMMHQTRGNNWSRAKRQIEAPTIVGLWRYSFFLFFFKQVVCSPVKSKDLPDSGFTRLCLTIR